MIFIALIKIYQFSSKSVYQMLGLPLNNCRFYPNCSEYATQAFSSYSSIKAIKLILNRLAKCHPWHKGGIDLLP